MAEGRKVSHVAVERAVRRLPRPARKRLRKAWRRYQRRFDPTWYRHTMGRADTWGHLGRLQFDYLVAHGLEPSHYLLDVGCGPLRGGVHFIRYLDIGRYYGVDRQGDKLKVGRDVELRPEGLLAKRPVLEQMNDFGFERLGRTFDYALAQSVFSHLSLNKILRCLMSVERALVPGGKFFATFYLNDLGKQHLEPIEQTPGVFTRMDRDPFHYDPSVFDWMCAGTALSPEYLGDWGSPRNQKMMLFTKS